MYRYKNKLDSGCYGPVADAWEPYRSKYPDPLAEEWKLIGAYMPKFEWELDDFNESRPDWISLKERLRCPNLRDLLIKFLRQVRGSKGYDVDLYFDFIAYPFTVFVPRRLDDKKFYDQAMAATTFAIGEINSLMMGVGKHYKLVGVDKLVSASVRWDKVDFEILLLTFTANDNEKEDDVITFQAMVQVCQPQSTCYKLKEWKFKPTFIPYY